jgi:hypothetical protein
MPAPDLVVRGADLDARHLLELHDADAMISKRIWPVGIRPVEAGITGAQVEDHERPQAGQQHRQANGTGLRFQALTPGPTASAVVRAPSRAV